MSVVSATFQPLPTPPTTFSSGIRALLDEELVELGLAGDLAQRAHLDRVLLHVHQEVGEALVLGLRRWSVRATSMHHFEYCAPRRPDLLAR